MLVLVAAAGTMKLAASTPLHLALSDSMPSGLLQVLMVQ